MYTNGFDIFNSKKNSLEYFVTIRINCLKGEKNETEIFILICTFSYYTAVAGVFNRDR